MERSQILSFEPAGRRIAADWLTLFGAAVLFASLFFTWSHQFPSSLGSLPAMRLALSDVPRDANAWQVYSVADALLGALAVGLCWAAALRAARGPKLVLMAACGVALAFVVHALGVAPTSGADVLIPGSTRYVGSLARSGEGEPLAIAGLGAAIVGLGLSLPAW